MDIFAPGKEIKSAWRTSDTATNTLSGTSMASPFVAAKVALLLDEESGLAGSPDTIKQRVITYNATHRVLASSSLPSGTPNKLMFSRDGLYRPDKSTGFFACMSTTIARYSLVTDGDYGPDTESYTREIDRGAVGSWSLIDTSTDIVTLFDVESNSQFRVRGRYEVTDGISDINTSSVITAPDCSHCHFPPCI